MTIYNLHKSAKISISVYNYGKFQKSGEIMVTECRWFNHGNINKLNKYQHIINKSTKLFTQKLISIIDNVRAEQYNITLLLCGGGAKLVPNDFKCNGIEKIIIPKYAEIANAIGATSLRVSSELDKIIDFEGINREETIQKVECLIISME